MKSFDASWETRMYARSKQVMRYPFGDLVSRVLRLHPGGGRGLRVLELGCGTGNNLVFLAKEGFETHGIEGSKTACAKARAFVSAQGVQAAIVEGDFVGLPYPDAHFDLIIDRESVCHNRKAAIAETAKEVRRCLKSGGRFLSYAFSRRHGDIKACGGKPVEPGTYSGFKSGALAPAGITHFFTRDEIRGVLFGGLKLDYIFHHSNDWLYPKRRNEIAEFIACGQKA